ncbi:MAG: hypothetical protein ABI559_01650 [Chloroflexota bacterium]
MRPVVHNKIDPHEHTPRRKRGNGNWIAVGGWTLKVADDGTACPAAMLGLVRLGRE